MSETSKTCATGAIREDKSSDPSHFLRRSRESRANNGIRPCSAMDRVSVSGKIWERYGKQGPERQENVRRLRGDFGEKFFDFDMGEDDVGLSLKSFVITSFETIAFL